MEYGLAICNLRVHTLACLVPQIDTFGFIDSFAYLILLTYGLLSAAVFDELHTGYMTSMGGRNPSGEIEGRVVLFQQVALWDK